MHKWISMLVICAMVFPNLPGCASKYGEQKTDVNYYPACYRPIQELRNSENNVAKSTAGGAALGALGGALLGFLVSGGKWEGAVIGGATGGVAGTMAGHAYGSSARQADDNRRMAAYMQNMEGDISDLNIVSASARASLECYDRQFAVLIRDIKAKTIDRQAAAARYGEISSGREEAISLLGDAAYHARNLDQQYEQAFIQEQRQVAASVARGGNINTARKKAVAINTAKKKKVEITQKAEMLDREKVQAQSSSTAQLREYKEALEDLRT